MEALTTPYSFWHTDVVSHYSARFYHGHTCWLVCVCGWSEDGSDTDELFDAWKEHVEGSMT